jgi:hypothetical protein
MHLNKTGGGTKTHSWHASAADLAAAAFSIMTRHDWLFLLSVIWFIGLLAATVWVFLSP